MDNSFRTLLVALLLSAALGACVSTIKPLGQPPAGAAQARGPGRPGETAPRLTTSLVQEPEEPTEEVVEAPTPAAPPEAATPEAAAAPEAAATPSERPEAENPEAPPALDIESVSASTQLSDLSLAQRIKDSPPASATSLRLVDKAREQIVAGKPDDAIRSLGRAVSIDPTNPWAYFYLGRAWFVKQNYAQALTFFQRAELGFGSEPQWLGETLGFEGASYELSGQLAQAESAYKRALDTSPGNLMARVGYVRVSTAAAPPAESGPQPAPEASPAATAPDSAIPPPPEMPPPAPAPAEAAPPPPS